MSLHGPLRVGIGGPVGAGKTTLTEHLCRALAHRLSMAVITNDIYTREDADYLTRMQVLPAARIRGVETGGCPHTAIREDASINLAAVAELNKNFPDPDPDLILIESGGTTSPPPSPPNSPTSQFTSSTPPQARISRARMAPASPAPTFSSSIKPTSPLTSASTSPNSKPIPKPPAAPAPTSWPAFGKG